MAFTTAQQVHIRFFLGYPFPFQQLNPRLEGAIALVGADATATGMVAAMLTKLLGFYGLDPAAQAPPVIDQAIGQAGIKVVESADDKIEFGTTSGKGGETSSAILDAQNAVAKQLVGALSSMFGVEIASDVFSRRGYSGDGWQSNQMSRTGRSFTVGC